MRKVLTIALVALIAASLFAGVKTSGYVQGAVNADFADGEDAVFNTAEDDNKAQLVMTDENSIWGTTITVQNTKSSGLMSKTWLDIMKVAQVESNFAAKVTFLTYDKVTALSAYTNNADDMNTWRLRTENDGHGVNAEFGYSKYVKAQAGMQFYQGAVTKDNRDDKMTIVTSVLGTPVDGVKLSAGMKMYNIKMDEKGDGYDTSSGYTVAAEADAGKLADLDFSLAAGVAYTKYECDNDGCLTVQVFGGYEGITGYVEVGFLDIKKYTKLGAAYQINDKADVGAYFATIDYTDIDFDTNVVVGVEGNYKLNDAVSFFAESKYVFKNFVVEGRMKVAF